MLFRNSTVGLKVWLLWAVVLTLAGCEAPPLTLNERPGPSASTSPKSQEASTVPFCELINSSERYRGKLVRTQIIVTTFPENQYVYDPSCYSKDTLTWLDFDGNEPYEALNSNLRTLQRSGRPTRVYVNALGRLDGPFKEGVGHLSAFKYRFILTAVERVDAVPDEVPTPGAKVSQ